MPVAEEKAARILLVEEQTLTATRIVDMLRPVAGSVLRAATCHEAQEMLDDSVELVIANLAMSDADPLRLVSQWRANETSRRLPILLMADDSELPRLAKGLDLGANDYLVRPVDRNELLARVKSQIHRKRLEDRLRDNYQRSLALALTDELTGLYNRRYVFAHLNGLIGRMNEGAGKTALLLFDIDHFKAVNDRHGHPAGDAVLRELADRAVRQVRNVDLVGRLGGEEFVVVMPETSLAGAVVVAERLRAAIANEPFQLEDEGNQLPITVSVGIAMTGEGSDTLDTLLKRADDALYAAKRSGRNRVIALTTETPPEAMQPIPFAQAS